MLRKLLITLLAAAAGSVVAAESAMPPAGEPMGDPAAGATKAVTCIACHGQDGQAILGEYPNLAGQHYSYLLKQMRYFKSGERYAVLMAGQVDNLSDDDLRDIAAYYAGQDLQPGRAASDGIALGERIYRGGLADKQVPACIACHSPRGRGNGPATYPVLAGQNADYVSAQLLSYRAGDRQTDEVFGGMMRGAVRNLNDEEIEAVANYVSGLQ